MKFEPGYTRLDDFLNGVYIYINIIRLRSESSISKSDKRLGIIEAYQALVLSKHPNREDIVYGHPT